MVYTGKPSGGCEACRRRHIKCDEAKPTCSYCLKKQIICHMPKSQFDIAWRDQNAVASKAVQRRLNAIEKSDRDRSTRREIVKHSYQDVPRVLPQDFEGYALGFFFTSFLAPPEDSSFQRGYLDCLYPIWTQMSPKSPLRPAVNAVALSLLEAWSFANPNSAQSLARPHYARGIAAVRRRLQDAREVDDDVLMATLLLDMYDGILSFCGSRPHEGPHMAGSRALVEQRRRLPFSSEISQRILLAVRSQVVGKALSRGEPISSDVLDWKTSTLGVPKSPGFELEEIDLEVANLQVYASGLMVDPATKDPSALETLAKANELDQRLVAWIATIPDDWVPTCIWDTKGIPRSVRDAGCYQDHCTVYKSVFIADVFNGYCCSRIKVQLVIQACLKYLDNRSFDTHLMNARNTVQDLADMICASIPYHLGDRVKPSRIDDNAVEYPAAGSKTVPIEHYSTAAVHAGYLLIKRLPSLLQPGVLLRAGQREWVLGQMQRIKKIYLASPQKVS